MTKQLKQQQQIETIALVDIRTEFYVRQAPSEERILHFMYLYGENADIPPLLLARMPSGKYVLIDGRHRKEALEQMGRTTADCIITTTGNRLELTMTAIASNLGGSKEMTMADIRMTIIGLLDNGFTRTKIRTRLPYPKEMARKMVNDAWMNWHATKVRAAADEVRTGTMSLSKAAGRYDVQEDSITSLMRRDERRAENQHGTSYAQVKSTITQAYYRATQTNNRVLKGLVEAYTKGEFTQKQVDELFTHALHEQRVHAGSLGDWKERLQVLLRTNRPFDAGTAEAHA